MARTSVWPHLARRRAGPARGAIGALTAVLAPAVIMLAGLVLDGGLALEARARGLDVAEQAARAAANECDEAVLRTDSVCRVTDFGKAQSTAAAFMGNGVTMVLFDLDDGGQTVVVQ